MPKYRVHIFESSTSRRFRDFWVDDEEMAQELAEEEDWRTWELEDDDSVSVDSYIDRIDKEED